MKRTIKIIIYSLLAIFLLMLGTEFWLQSKIKTWVEKEVSAKTKGAVSLKIDRVKVNLIGRTLKLKRVSLLGDSLLLAKHNIPFYALECSFDELAIEGVRWEKRDSSRIVQIRELNLRSPFIELTGKPTGKTDEKVFREKIDGLLNTLEIGKINLSLENVWYKQQEKQEWIRTSGQNIHVDIEHFKWNVMLDSLSRAFTCEALVISSDHFQRELQGGNLVLDINGIHLDGRVGNIRIDSLGLLPRLPKEEYAVKTGRDWTRVKAWHITGEQWDFHSLLTGRLIKVEHVQVQDVAVHSFKNRKIDQPEREKPLFYQGVQRFPCGLEIQEINIPHVNIVYEELSKNGNVPGKLTFNNLNGQFQGLTNMVKTADPYYKLTVRGQLMNAGDFYVFFHFPVAPSNSHFRVEGELRKMRMPLLNPMITPLTKLKIESGEIQRMNFHISGNAVESTTQLQFLYDDFTLTLLREKDGHLKKVSMLTDIINGVLVRENNLPGDKVREAKVQVRRDIYRSQFNYLWRSLFAGIWEVVEE